MGWDGKKQLMLCYYVRQFRVEFCHVCLITCADRVVRVWTNREMKWNCNAVSGNETYRPNCIFVWHERIRLDNSFHFSARTIVCALEERFLNLARIYIYKINIKVNLYKLKKNIAKVTPRLERSIFFYFGLVFSIIVIIAS